MKILEKIAQSRSEFIGKNRGKIPTHLHLTPDEGFDTLAEIMPTLKLTAMQRAELKFVLDNKHLGGLKEAFKNSHLFGAEVIITEQADGS